ncbi:hypothetical protein BKA70DRAFT_1339598 [Coprinopsis sp. MPI-PUGE-AT-0042]|nr:hypothetical protein BKA70DRAFT_1339598 [Coprinopsis sp. MPI-PUGE-AT-0042]
MGFECGNCERRFYSDNAMESHCRATGHSRIWYCDPCDRWFRSEHGLENHLLYAAAHAIRYDCLDCGRNFRFEDALFSHCKAKGHRWRWYCDLCDREFKTEDGLEKHCNSAVAHRTCDPCNRVFDTVSGYETHCDKSLKHRQRTNQSVECHFCDRVFKSPSAYAQHIESGVHKVTRHHVTQAVHSLRVVPQITLPISQFNAPPPSTTRIESWDDEWAVDADTSSALDDGWEATISAAPQPVEAGPPLREEGCAAATGAAITGPLAVAAHGPRQTSFGFGQLAFPIFTITEYIPADFIHLGIPYACHLCFQTFRNVFALTMHMNSAAHDPDAFVCPNAKCRKQFTLISGLMQHIESGTCGLASRQEVYQRFEKLTGRFSKLLKAA